jgi:uncharacterized protein (DUF2141 family)
MLVAAIIAGLAVVCRKSRLHRGASEGGEQGRFALRRRILVLFALFALFTLLACAGTSHAGGVERRRISVRISCPKGGVLHAFLVDRAMFRRPMAGLQQRVSRVAGKGVVTLSFDGVPPGTYGVRCFLDTNGNGKLDRGWFGPTEPWGMSFHGGRPRRWPRWDEMKFTIADTDEDIRIVMAQ